MPLGQAVFGVPLVAVVLAAFFVASLVWLVQHWNAKGPTDLWKDEDIDGGRPLDPGELSGPPRPDPHGQIPLVLIGYWASGDEPEWPDPRRFIDPTWDPRERAMVIAHLQNGWSPWGYAGFSICRLCGVPNGVNEFTDGVYLWPEGLAHYLAAHDVRLPAVFVLHVKTSLESGVRRPELYPTRLEEELRQVDRDWWRSTQEP